MCAHPRGDARGADAELESTRRRIRAAGVWRLVAVRLGVETIRSCAGKMRGPSQHSRCSKLACMRVPPSLAHSSTTQAAASAPEPLGTAPAGTSSMQNQDASADAACKGGKRFRQPQLQQASAWGTTRKRDVLCSFEQRTWPVAHIASLNTQGKSSPHALVPFWQSYCVEKHSAPAPAFRCVRVWRQWAVTVSQREGDAAAG